jgi:hypothetical protein
MVDFSTEFDKLDAFEGVSLIGIIVLRFKTKF